MRLFFRSLRPKFTFPQYTFSAAFQEMRGVHTIQHDLLWLVREQCESRANALLTTTRYHDDLCKCINTQCKFPSLKTCSACVSARCLQSTHNVGTNLKLAIRAAYSLLNFIFSEGVPASTMDVRRSCQSSISNSTSNSSRCCAEPPSCKYGSVICHHTHARLANYASILVSCCWTPPI